jgi:hypothetical protein
MKEAGEFPHTREREKTAGSSARRVVELRERR